MTFTDDDLTRLKEPGERIDFEWLFGKIPALIARVEAAEKLIRTFDCAYKFVNTDISKCGEMHDEALEAWRKAAGK
jgi:hypothetical protein